MKRKKVKNLLIYDAVNRLLIKNRILAPKLYKENFKIPESTNGNNQCTDCNAEIVSNSKFCRMCGRFPI